VDADGGEVALSERELTLVQCGPVRPWVERYR